MGAVLQGFRAVRERVQAGGKSDFEKRPSADIELVGADGGASRAAATAPQFSEVRLSPDGRRFAALRQTGVYRPDSGEPLPLMSTELSGVVVGSLDGEKTVERIAGIRDVVARSLRWSPDGESLAFLGRPADSSDENPRVFRCRMRPVACAVVGPDLDPTPPIYGEPGLVWSSRTSSWFRPRPGDPAATARRRRSTGGSSERRVLRAPSSRRLATFPASRRRC